MQVKRARRLPFTSGCRLESFTNSITHPEDLPDPNGPISPRMNARDCEKRFADCALPSCTAFFRTLWRSPLIANYGVVEFLIAVQCVLRIAQEHGEARAFTVRCRYSPGACWQHLHGRADPYSRATPWLTNYA
jgi:hypothetical protein